MTFPHSIPTDADAVVIEFADLDGDSIPEAVMITKTKKERTSEYALQAMRRKGPEVR